MPEIKNNFTGGKMNKDLDERLIPNGQYRDAMNIQVSTSEGFDVGTVQNILGNYEAPGQSLVSDEAFCVGSISDEKNDKLYWFVLDGPGPELITNGNFDTDSQDWVGTGFASLPIDGWSYDSSNESILATDVEKWKGLHQENVNIVAGRTYLIKCKISNFSGTGDLSPVIVDENGVWTRPGVVHQIVGQSYHDYRDYVATDNGKYEWVLRASVTGVAGQEVAYTPPGWVPYQPNQIYFQNRAETDTSKPSYQASNFLNCNIDNISIRSVGASYIFQYDTKANKVIPVFVDTNNSVLKFDPNKLITGINIVDDLLFWTDNNSEPKKINIKRSIEGTDNSGNQPTRIINPQQNISYTSGDQVQEDNITVIKKAPARAPNIEAIGFRDPNLDYTGVIRISDSFSHTNSFINSSIGRIHDFNFLKVGDVFSTIIEKDIQNKSNFHLQWNVGDKVVLKEFNEDGMSPEVPILDYSIKGTITDSQVNSFTNTNFLLTNNGNLLDGSGSWPTDWGGLSAANWTWDQVNGKIIGGGSPSAQYTKVYNSNNNTGPAGSGYGDIIDGRAYRIKYTIEPPDNGDMLGKLDVRLFSKDPGTTGDGHYWQLGFHNTPGSYDHEIVFDNVDQGVGATLPAGKGDITFQGNGTYLNSIFFQSLLGSQSLGPELADITKKTASTTGTTVGRSYFIGLSGAQGAPNHYTWASMKKQEIYFFHTGIHDSVFGSGKTTAVLNNIQESGLEDQAQYEIELTISEMTFTGTGNMYIGVANNSGVGNDVRIIRSAGTGTVATQAGLNDEWTGLGGYVSKTFTATGNSRIDLFAYATNDISSTQGPTGIINISLKKIETPSFKGKISNVSVEEIDETVASVEVKIDAIDGVPQGTHEGKTSLNYAIDLFQEEEDRLLEDKFARFAYRYKYADGEVSAISPFSNVVFAPGAFDYHPKKGHNLGMSNNLKTLRIKDYSLNLPKDVTGIDIVYKEENSPNIYMVDSPKDFENPYSSYEIRGNQLKGGALPSNQLLRPWDNVPKRALAQEIVGNRVVYGNYIQNYDLTNPWGGKYKIDMYVDNSATQHVSQVGKKSIKSLRDYQVGIVFGDAYGRETPVLTDPKAVARIGKINSSTANELSVSIWNQEHPVNMKYFKFFVKDVGGEYYNLAMDRYYDAEDGNIWLAFPSTDRNKIDIDDYLILKKGAGATSRDLITKEVKNVIKDKAQYKILDIKNEAPDYIKRKESLLSSLRHVSGDTVFLDSDLPSSGDANFSIDYDKVSSSAIAQLHNNFYLDNLVEYHISLSNTVSNRVSNRYKIIGLNADTASNSWVFTLEKPFSNEINDFTNDESGVNSVSINNETYLNIYKTAIDNSASHKFDGRFFVKIYNDDIFRKALKDRVSEEKPEYKSTNQERKIYSLKTISGSTRIEKLGSSSSAGGLTLDAVTSNAFDGIGRDNTSNGLNEKVASNIHAVDKNGASLFTWRNYRNQAEVFYHGLGTLNNKKVTNYDPNNIANNTFERDATRDRAVWMDYDAYFRGINVYVGNDSIKDRVNNLNVHDTTAEGEQNFQDVWFIDDATHNGNFTFSNLTNPEDSDFDSNSGWKTLTQTWRNTSIGIRSWGSGPNGTSEIELAFGGIQPVKWIDGGDQWASDPTFFDLAGENTNYSEREKDFIEQIAIGSQFRFKEDPTGTIYTITDVQNILKIRYENLQDYVGPAIRNYTEDTAFKGLKPGNMRSPKLSTYHAKSIAGEATGHYSTHDSALYSNVTGHQVHEEDYEKTKVEAEENSITWKLSSFLRPSNYTRNWRIKVDKNISENWNPVEDTTVEISNQDPIVLKATNAGGANYVEVEGTTANPDPLIGLGDNKNKLSVGMVLKNYDNNGNNTFSDTMSPAAIVSKIHEVPESDPVKYNIYLKTYDGTEGWGTGAGTPTNIASGDQMQFYYYPMNGLSPNAAKNLNYFRAGKGFTHSSSATAGTDAVGYTIEFVEEKSSRSEEEILPENPAVWETKPKQTESKDLDIYYEASEAIPIYEELTKENMLELIPIGSTVEHVGSNAINPGTTVVDVNPVIECIILSDTVLVEQLSGEALWEAWKHSFGWAGSSTLLEKLKITAAAQYTGP